MLTARAASSRLGVAVRTVYDLAKRGLLKSYKIGKAVRFDERDVEEFKQKCQSTTTEGTRDTASRSAVSLKVSDTELAAFFLKRGVKPKLTNSTAGKSAGSTRLRLVAEQTP